MRTHEKPQQSNPHGLTINQHVFPRRSVVRFANHGGYVQLHDIVHNVVRPAKADDPIFCAKRVWDQRAEVGFMKSIEDEFQSLVDALIGAGVPRAIPPQHWDDVSRFFILWWARAEFADQAHEDVPFKGVTGHAWPKDQQEQMEKAGGHFFREGGTMPSRFLHGMRIQKFVDVETEPLTGKRWGMALASAGRFVVPNRPACRIVPVSRSVSLIWGCDDAIIDEREVDRINDLHIKGSDKYYFESAPSPVPSNGH